MTVSIFKSKLSHVLDIYLVTLKSLSSMIMIMAMINLTMHKDIDSSIGECPHSVKYSIQFNSIPASGSVAGFFDLE